MTTFAQVIRAEALGFAYRRQYGFRAQAYLLGPMATGAGALALLQTRSIELEQLRQGVCSYLVHGGTHCHLDGF